MTLKRPWLAGMFAALGTLLPSCGDGPVTMPGGWRSPASWSSLVYATQNGPLALAVHGSPDDPARATPQWREQAAAAMSGQTPSRPFALTLAPDQAPHPQYRVVLVFHPAKTADPRHVCQGRISQLPDAGEKITVLAVFCDGESLLASASGWVRPGDDHRIIRLLSQIARDLFGSAP